MDTIDSNSYTRRIAAGLVLLDFSAQWCQPCQLIKPLLQELEDEHKEIVFLTLDCDENKSFIKELGITSVPTLHLYQDGKLLKAVEGLQTKAALENWLDSYG